MQILILNGVLVDLKTIVSNIIWNQMRESERERERGILAVVLSQSLNVLRKDFRK